jgi:chromosome segregation ATPase
MGLGIVNTAADDGSKYVAADKVGAAGGVAQLDASGKVPEAQIPEIDRYTKKETETKISDAVGEHNKDTTAHNDLRTEIGKTDSKISEAVSTHNKDTTAHNDLRTEVGKTDGKISEAVSTHNKDADAHSDIRAEIAEVKADLAAVELRYGTNVTENPFTVSFASIDGLTATGVWDEENARLEF